MFMYTLYTLQAVGKQKKLYYSCQRAWCRARHHLHVLTILVPRTEVLPHPTGHAAILRPRRSQAMRECVAGRPNHFQVFKLQFKPENGWGVPRHYTTWGCQLRTTILQRLLNET